MENNNAEEYVKISLDRYHGMLLNDTRKANLLDELYEEIMNIVDDELFDIDRTIDKKIYKIYERLCKEI